MADALLESLDAVCNARSFVAFLQALLDDLPSEREISATSPEYRYLVGVAGWMNQDLPSFLEAAIAGGTDIHSRETSATSAQAWKTAAEIVYLGKIYE